LKGKKSPEKSRKKPCKNENAYIGYIALKTVAFYVLIKIF